MRKLIAPFMVTTIGLFFFITSCKKETKVAFTNTAAKNWFDTRCASCHASGKSNANNWLYDPSDYNTSIKGHIDHIYEQMIQYKSMPPALWQTSDSTTFITWYNAGYPAN